MKRGFKTEARDLARDVRTQMGLGQTSPVDVWELAKWLGIPVVTLSEFKEEAGQAVEYFRTDGTSVFSAVTIFNGSHRLIVHNDFHSQGRQASNISHELSHGLLLHPPTPVLDERGCRYWSKDIEDEANWLASVLLVPDAAALSVVRRGMSIEDAAAVYGVSKQMMNFRINVSGARKRVRRLGS